MVLFLFKPAIFLYIIGGIFFFFPDMMIFYIFTYVTIKYLHNFFLQSDLGLWVKCIYFAWIRTQNCEEKIFCSNTFSAIVSILKNISNCSYFDYSRRKIPFIPCKKNDETVVKQYSFLLINLLHEKFIC